MMSLKSSIAAIAIAANITSASLAASKTEQLPPPTAVGYINNFVNKNLTISADKKTSLSDRTVIYLVRSTLGLDKNTNFDKSLADKIIEFRKNNNLPVKPIIDRDLLKALCQKNDNDFYFGLVNHEYSIRVIERDPVEIFNELVSLDYKKDYSKKQNELVKTENFFVTSKKYDKFLDDVIAQCNDQQKDIKRQALSFKLARKLGIDYPGRLYQLCNQDLDVFRKVLHMKAKPNWSKPQVAVITPWEDHNGAFYYNDKNYNNNGNFIERLIRSGINVSWDCLQTN